MKLCRAFGITLALLSLAAGAYAQAPQPVTITVDEDGNGFINFGGGGAGPLEPFVDADPGPGGQAAALQYDLGQPPSIVAGDVFLTDPDTSVSDIIRFNPENTDPFGDADLVFYSKADDNVFNIADLFGMPTANYANTASVPEVGTALRGVAQYTPTEGQPGFVEGFDVKYTFISGVPEPSSLAVFAIAILGCGGLIVARRRKQNA